MAVIAGTLLPDVPDDRVLFQARAFSAGDGDDFCRYEEIIGEQPDLPKGLVWAHRVDHCPSTLFPEASLLDAAIERVRPNKTTEDLMRKMRAAQQPPPWTPPPILLPKPTKRRVPTPPKRRRPPMEVCVSCSRKLPRTDMQVVPLQARQKRNRFICTDCSP